MGNANHLAKCPKIGWGYLSRQIYVVLMPLVAIAIAATPRTARAKTITVNTLTDEAIPGDRLCSLREAINNANSATDTTDGDCAAGTGDDVIDFKVEGTITLTSTLPEIFQALKIDGGGQVIIDGASSFQVLLVNSGATVEVDNLTIENGKAGFSASGGGIFNGGTLTVIKSTVSGDTSIGGSGGGIFNSGTVTITNSTVFGSAPNGNGGGIFNSGTLAVTSSSLSGSTFGLGNFGGPGGGIFNSGTLTVTNSSVSGGFAPRSCGAGIFNGGIVAITNSTIADNFTILGAGAGIGAGICNSGELTVINSTISGNFSGGIFSGGTLTVTNSTIAENFTPVFAGGITAFGPTTIANSTIWGNGGGIFFSEATATTVSNSILADNFGNCFSNSFPPTPPIDGGNNISDDSSCGFATATAANGATIGDNVDPLIDPNGLQSNGGPTQTIALQSTSPAIDAIPAASCPATDQRGIPRPDNFETACDIGSYEFFDFAGQPGQGDCKGKSISALNKQFGKLAAAASALGFPSVKALKAAVQAFCEG